MWDIFGQKEVVKTLNLILECLQDIKKGVEAMTPELQILAEQIALNTSVEQSAIAVIEDLSDKIEAAKADPEKIVKLAANLKASAAALGMAVAMNTIADPAMAAEKAEEPAAPGPLPEAQGKTIGLGPDISKTPPEETEMVDMAPPFEQADEGPRGNTAEGPTEGPAEQ